jgi:putative colanic acid biosynthesis acetyltransferase WcaF
MIKVRLDLFDSTMNFKRGASTPKFIFWYLLKSIFFLSAIPYPSKFKAFILRCFGAKVGVGLVLKPRVNIHFPWKLAIGDHVWIGEEALLLNFENLIIGSHVCISQRVFLCGGNHDFKIVTMPYRNGSITLENGCWVGANCFIGPNVTIGNESVISAGSVVTKSLAENGIYCGNPAKFIKERWKIV